MKEMEIIEMSFMPFVRYGFHVSHNSYYLCYEPITINKVFENIRNFPGNNGSVSGVT